MTNEGNQLLRAAYQIAKRNGENTNWEAFANNLQEELLKQLGVSGSEKDKQIVLRATCTPRVYKQHNYPSF